jgi:RNA polymerase sigma factor (sigma-70 family)
MEISNCALRSKIPGVAIPDLIQPGSIGKESSATLIEDPSLQASLRRIVAGVCGNAVLQEDLTQEGLIHLWEIERSKPGRTKSWYLQSCRFHFQHWLAAGRSLDSPKRARAHKRIVLDENDSEAALPEYHTNGEVFEVVSFRDMLSTLAKHLKPREQIVLCALAEGLSVSEIASRFAISRPTVLKDRRTIAALTISLGISQPVSRVKQHESPGSPAKKAASEVRGLPAGLAWPGLQFPPLKPYVGQARRPGPEPPFRPRLPDHKASQRNRRHPSGKRAWSRVWTENPSAQPQITAAAKVALAPIGALEIHS